MATAEPTAKTGWKVKSLGDLCDIARGGSPRPIQSFLTEADNGINWIKIGDATASEKYIYETKQKIKPEGISRSRMVEPGDFLLSNSMSFGRPYIMKTSGCIHDGWLVLSDKSGEFDPDFLYHYLGSQHAYRQFDGLAAGSTVRNLNIDLVRRVTIPVPPLAEQERIVGILDEAFEGIAAATAQAEKNLHNARELFQSVLQSTMEGKLASTETSDQSVLELLNRVKELRQTAKDQGRIKKTRSKSDDEETAPPFILPKTWRWVPLEKLTVVISDGVHKKPNYLTEGIPFITVKNLTEGDGISFENLNYISKQDHEEYIKRTHPEKGDILITKDGTIGVVRVVETDIDFSIFVSVALVKPITHDLTYFLAYALSAPGVQGQIVPKGTALKHLYLTDLRRLLIPLPGLPTQQAIVKKLDALSDETKRLESIYERKKAALAELKQSLLQKAFAGEL